MLSFSTTFLLTNLVNVLAYNMFHLYDENAVIEASPKEASLFTNFNTNVQDIQPIMDILSDFKIFARPSNDNIREIMEKAGKFALIKNPLFSMQSIVNGMGRSKVGLHTK